MPFALLLLAAGPVIGADRVAVEARIDRVEPMLATRALRCTDLVAAYIRRIRAYDASRGVRAITRIMPGVMAEARRADARRVDARHPLPPLHCVPIVVKDNIDVAGSPTTAGSIALARSVPAADAPAVAALRRAGAIVIARTNMAEWAFSPRRTISSTAGETANAYAIDRVPAGSSGGTASAVAASFALAGLGTDTGNSIRGPSSHLGLVGMRATLGLVSIDGVVPLLADRDVLGPMTRTVADNARLLSVLATTGGTGREEDYAVTMRAHRLAGVRLGVARALADPADSDPAVLAVFEEALDHLRAAGATLVDVALPTLDADRRADSYCPRFRADVNRYLARLGPRAPLRDVAEVYRSGRYAPQSAQSFARFIGEGAAVHGSACPSFDTDQARQLFRAHVVAAMDAAKVDALLYPSWRYPPARRTRAEEDYRGDNSQIIAPATGLPALTVPMGATHGGLPAGLQWLGRPWSEALLYGLADDFTTRFPGRTPPPGFPALTRHARR